MTTCDRLAEEWPKRWPRPDAENTKNNGRQVRKFGRDFAGRDPQSITRSEGRSWCLINLGSARYVRTMFNDFLDDGLIEENVFAGVSLPKPDSKQIVVPTEAQIQTLYDVAIANRRWQNLAARIIFAADVGLRFAEQQVVLLPGHTRERGNSFNADLTRLEIAWQRGRDGQLKPPKTARGVRPVMVPERARNAVRDMAQGGNPYLWFMSRQTWSTEWGDLRREAGVWIRHHDLRHYCATRLLNAGATVDDVAVQLGCRPEEVRDTYGHPDPELALRRLERLIDG